MSETEQVQPVAAEVPELAPAPAQAPAPAPVHEQAAAPAQTKASDKNAQVDDILSRWFNTHMNNSPVSRSHGAYAHVRACLHNLRNTLVKEL